MKKKINDEIENLNDDEIEFDFQGIEVVPIEKTMLKDWKNRAENIDSDM